MTEQKEIEKLGIDVNKPNIFEEKPPKGVFKSWGLAAHPGGTVKINELVDADLKTQRDNLYVCDCSVIPEAWGLPSG